MSRIQLSICIPVYNFGAFLPETLDSIVRQATDAVEIVVLDGGSTDDTPRVVAGFQAAFPRLRYIRRDVKGGIDRDMARAVEGAQGEYCWLFSGDDVMRPGAIGDVLRELESGCDVYLVEAMLCRLDMSPIVVHKMSALDRPTTFDLRDREQRLSYFRLARNTAAFFSFCSAVVVKKMRWDDTAVDESFMGSCWAHAARIFAMLPAGLVVRYLPGRFLDKRGDNDSFLTNGLTRRFAIAVDGYNTIADVFFGHDSAEAFHIRRAVRAELPLSAWLVAKLEIATCRSSDEYGLLYQVASKNFSDPGLRNWVALTACRAVPGPMLRFAQLTVRRVRAVAQRRGAPGR